MPADTLIEFLHTHAPVAVLTGAGLSTASGIPDYRDENGNWKRKQPVQHQEFVRHLPVRQRYWARSLVGFPVMQQAQPNIAHLGIRQLEQAGLIGGIITQNVDRLHQKAGSLNAVDLHGRADEVICMECGYRRPRQQMHEMCAMMNPDFRELSAQPAPDGDADLEIDFDHFRVPDCPMCGGIIKPDVVFFGDTVPRERVDVCFDLLNNSRALLVVGSSLMVYSGFRFARHAHQHGKALAILTRGKTRADDLVDIKLDADIAGVFAALTQKLPPAGINGQS